MSDKPTVYNADLALGTLKVYDDHCVLSAKKNWVSFFVTNKYFNGEKKFYYSDLTSVQFREPGKITDGYIEFEYPGSRSGSGGGAYSSENALAFGKKDLMLMRMIYEFIDSKISEARARRNSPASTVASSPMEELKKCKELLDCGIITQEEFDTKKKQLLGL